MICYKQVDSSCLEAYEKIPMTVHVKSIYMLNKVYKGLGGILLEETPVDEYIKDLNVYEPPTTFAVKFDLTNWAFFMAFDDENPVGAITVAARTANVGMLDGRDDMSILWDIRMSNEYKHQGIGTTLFSMAVNWSKSMGLKQMKIECQNNNNTACKFYAKQGAVLGEINEYAYYKDEADRDEVRFIWYLDL